MKLTAVRLLTKTGENSYDSPPTHVRELICIAERFDIEASEWGGSIAVVEQDGSMQKYTVVLRQDEAWAWTSPQTGHIYSSPQIEK